MGQNWNILSFIGTFWLEEVVGFCKLDIYSFNPVDGVTFNYIMLTARVSPLTICDGDFHMVFTVRIIWFKVST